MRISVNKNDSGYHPCAHMIEAILFNGNKVMDVVTADEEFGEILCYKKDDCGSLIYNHLIDEAEKVTLKGKVQIVLGDRFTEAVAALQLGG